MTKAEWREATTIPPTVDAIKYLNDLLSEKDFDVSKLATKEVEKSIASLLNGIRVSSACGATYGISGELLRCTVRYKDETEFNNAIASGLFPNNMWKFCPCCKSRDGLTVEWKREDANVKIGNFTTKYDRKEPNSVIDINSRPKGI